MVQYRMGATLCGSSGLKASGDRVMAYDYLANLFISPNNSLIGQTNSFLSATTSSGLLAGPKLWPSCILS